MILHSVTDKYSQRMIREHHEVVMELYPFLASGAKFPTELVTRVSRRNLDSLLLLLSELGA